MGENISRELLFAQILERVRRMAREQGNCISRRKVQEEFTELSLNEAQLEMVYDYLEKHKIGVDEPVDPDEALTEEERNYLQDYLNELAALPAYSQGELEAYGLSAMAGDSLAKQRLTEGCLKNVADIAKLYVGQGVFLEDLIGEGNVALAAGIEMLRDMRDSGIINDSSQIPGALARLVMDAMEKHIEESSANARTDKKAADKVNQVADGARELAEQLRRKVTPGELARETGMPLHLIRDAMRMSGYKIEDLEMKEEPEMEEDLFTEE